MNQRKLAYVNGLAEMKKVAKGRERLTRKAATVGQIRPRLYNRDGMPDSNTIVQGNCIEVLNQGPEGWVDLVFADPPFNIGYLYDGYSDQKKYQEYVDFSENWMRAVHRALKPGGSFYLAIGDEYAADLCYVARRKIGFHMRNWIIWHYTFGQQTKAKFAKSHTHIFYFTKDAKAFTFNADPVRVASARQTTYADARANPKGKLPDDTWYLRPQETTPGAYVEAGYETTLDDEAKQLGLFDPRTDTWYVSRLCGTFKEREGWHGCQMPVAVLDRVIKASSNPGDVVLDPFNGSGTTVVSAALLGRKYVGIDQSAEYVKFAQKRLAHALEAAATKGKDAAVTDTKRESRVLTPTDAFGRKRVPRKKAGRSILKTA
ncbi:MAG TPA: site-specific DNA-methyltransferase [Tepidisphaeraceae bacterium]|nr:site-specific DNA-methyltransferase [Tepidisphaeraceae bacterium]